MFLAGLFADGIVPAGRRCTSRDAVTSLLSWNTPIRNQLQQGNNQYGASNGLFVVCNPGILRFNMYPTADSALLLESPRIRY